MRVGDESGDVAVGDSIQVYVLINRFAFKCKSHIMKRA